MRCLLGMVLAATIAAPAIAAADGVTGDPPDLGTPLPTQGAVPALSGFGLGAGWNVLAVPHVPSVDLGHGVSTPRRAGTFTGFDMFEYVGLGGTAYGWFDFAMLRFTIDGAVGGSAGDDFMAGGTRYTDGTMLDIQFSVPAPGIGYRQRTWLVSAQLDPTLDLFDGTFYDTAATTSATTTPSGTKLQLELAVDVQACMQYNAFGFMERNSAACVFVAPVVYRDGFMQGATVGLRVFAL